MGLKGGGGLKGSAEIQGFTEFERKGGRAA